MDELQKSPKMNIELMKQFNKNSVLRIIRRNGPISRVQIANNMNLSRPSVSEIVSELMNEGWIRELSGTKQGRGRTPIPLVINPSGRSVIGIEIGSSQITIVLCNLNAEIMWKKTLPIKQDDLPVEVLDNVCSYIKHMIFQYQIPNNQLLGIGVAMHGIVDPQRGLSVFAPHLGWRNIPIKQHIESKLGCLVVVENDCNSSSLGELWFGCGQGEKNFITVLVDYGIGSSIITDGRIFHGVHHTAGQIGHITVDEDGPLCSCGNYGCLEMLSSEPAILRQVIKRLRVGETSVLNDWLEGEVDDLQIQDVYKAVHLGDPLAQDVLIKAGRSLGIGFANLINLFNPSFLILGGGIIEVADFILPYILEMIQKKVLGVEAKNTPVIVSELRENIYPVGAATLVMEKALEGSMEISI